MAIHCTASFLSEAQCVCVQFTGGSPFSEAEIEHAYQLIEECSTRHQTTNVLLDYTQIVHYTPNVLQVVKSAERLKKYHLDGNGYRFAALFSPGTDIAQNARLFLSEIASKVFLGKLDITHRIFFSYDDALAWITTPSP